MMNHNNKKNYMQLGFVLLTVVIFLLTYLVYNSSFNVFQAYVFQHDIRFSIFTGLDVRSSRIIVLIMGLCLLKNWQDLNHQRYLILMLLLMLSFILIFSVSLKTFAFFSALSRVVFYLTEPWRQLYVYPPLRATIEGIAMGLTGLVGLGSIAVENILANNLVPYQYVGGVIFLCLLFFLVLSKKLVDSEQVNVTQNPVRIWDLISKNSHVFFACFIAGVNVGMFNFSYILAHAVLPHIDPKYYQYDLYIGSIIGPIIIGIVADKKGIFSLIILSSITLIVCAFMSFMFFEIHLQMPYIYYAIAFLEGALGAGLATLSISLVGARLRFQGVFRAFALANIFYGAGIALSGRVEESFFYSFGIYKLVIGIVSSIFLAMLCYFLYREKIQEKNSGMLNH